MPLTQPAQGAQAQFGHANLQHSVQPFAPRERKVGGIADQRICTSEVSTRGLYIRCCWLEWLLLTSETVTTSEQGESDTDVRHAGVYRGAIAAVAMYRKGTIRNGRKLLWLKMDEEATAG